MIDNYSVKTDMIEEFEPITFREFKKTHWTGLAWEVSKFYEMKKSSNDLAKIKEWLQKNYNEPIYSKTWWFTFDGIVMHEKIYTHWKLCE